MPPAYWPGTIPTWNPSISWSLRHIRQHNHVIPRSQIRRAHVRVVNALRLESVVLQNPPRPPLINRGRPRPIEPDARLLDRDHVSPAAQSTPPPTPPYFFASPPCAPAQPAESETRPSPCLPRSSPHPAPSRHGPPCFSAAFTSSHTTHWLVADRKHIAPAPSTSHRRQLRLLDPAQSVARCVGRQRIGHRVHRHAHLQRQRPARHVIWQIDRLRRPSSQSRPDTSAAQTIPSPAPKTAGPSESPTTPPDTSRHWP